MEESDKTHCDHDAEFESALRVHDGIEQPSNVNADFISTYKSVKKPELSVDDYVDGILNGNRVILSRAITLVESSLPKHQQLAQEIIERCLPYSGKSVRLGITGVPGAGKSTTIEALGKHLTGLNHKVAVLAIDPSSERSKGSILGDKTRMEELSVDSRAFIRPSPSSGSLGGVARKTREIIILCEACGFDVVIVETVGVGQSEVAAHSMVDFFLLLQLANTGDELQGIKRGIMEMADAIAINKSEGENRPKAELAAGQYRNALRLFPLPESGWEPKVMLCSAYTKEGIADIWNMVLEYITFTKENEYFYRKRQEQNVKVLLESIHADLLESFYSIPGIKNLIQTQKEAVLKSEASPYVAAQKLIDYYFDWIRNKTS